MPDGKGTTGMREVSRTDRRALTVPGVAWDCLRAERSGPAGVAGRQRTRLADLVRFARERSPYYRGLYRGLPSTVGDPTLLPPVTKPELMSRFDEWVTDPDVTLDGVRAFVADPSLVGATYLGRHHVFTTSGTTGEPAVLLHDHDSWLVLNVVERLRARHSLPGPTELRALARHGYRIAAVVATGGHFGAVVLIEAIRRRGRWMARHVRSFSVLTPTPVLVEQLNTFRPTLLSGYPSALTLIADEVRAGRLHISPVLAMTAGETLSSAQRTLTESALGCRIVEGYSASEVPALSVACRHRRLHLNSDWYLVEPVDAHLDAVPVGELSHSVLVTNLANRVQPVIRYDLGDRVRVHPDPCRCGGPLPTVAVEGRTNDVLCFEPAPGSRVTVLPLALGTVVEETPGVHRFQAIRTAPAVLTVRVEPDAGADPAKVWAAVETRVRGFLDTQGLSSVRVEHDPEPPHADPRSGKLRQVWTAG